MDSEQLRSLLPDLQAVAEAFPGARAQIRHPEQIYRGLRIYRGQTSLQTDMLYLTEPGSGFPTDDYAYIACTPMEGGADHVILPGTDREEAVDTLMELFARFREYSIRLEQLVYRGDSLQELCDLGAELLGNPVYIHDDWFMMMARSAQVDEILPPEYVMTSTRGFLPRVIIDDFRDDSDYLETYSHRTAQVWHTGDGGDCLYVNMWEGAVYRGRLLVLPTNRPFRHEDFLLADVLTQRAISILHRLRMGEHTQSHSMDDIMYSLLQGGQPEAAELTQLLNLLHWSKTDRLVCIRVQNQRSDVTIAAEHILHSDLFRCFPGSYILITGGQQCVVLNLTRNPMLPGMLRHTLSPLCRDFLLYAGISSPVQGVRELGLAFYQAEIALNRAFRLHDDKWIVSFSDCALDHLLNSLDPRMQPWDLVSPDLRSLLDYDREKGTPYFETLREYLLQERDIPRTSEKLIIHRTTLLYRLKKIQSMITCSLDDPWQRLYLTLSLWILEQERK